MATTNGCEIVCRMPDGKGAVVVRVRANALGYEELPRDSPHRVEHALVGDPAPTKLPLDHARPRLGDAARASSLRERSKPGEAGGLTSAHASRQERKRDGEDVAGERHERDEADEHADRAEVCADRRSASRRAEGRRRRPRRRQRAENAADGARDRLRSATDHEADRTAERRRRRSPPRRSRERATPRIPVIATDRPSPSPRQSPIVYQLPTRRQSREAGTRRRALVLPPTLS